MAKKPVETIRCAIYCRTSSDERLGMEYNSLEAQRDAGENYVRSQIGLGWMALPEHFDDGGFSGGTLERPALKRLMAEVEAGRIDAIVVYKIDRLTRAILDFGKLVETFDRHEIRVVSVTEPMGTATSAGRLNLNVLLSFAQYEREIAGERIRDKIAASKRKGLFLGSAPIFGYDVDREKKCLVANKDEADEVSRIFRRFLALGSATEIAAELNAAGLRTKCWTTKSGKVKGGLPWNKSHIYRLLSNRTYLGEITHKKEWFPGKHEALVDQGLWDEVHELLAKNHRARGNKSRKNSEALLKGLIRCCHCDAAMSPTFTKRRGKTYRYYTCQKTNKIGPSACTTGSVPAAVIEKAVLDQLRKLLRSPEIAAQTCREVTARAEEELLRLKVRRADIDADNNLDDGEAQAKKAEVEADIEALGDHRLHESDVIKALEKIDPIWETLFPAERARIAKLLVARVDVSPDGLELRLRLGGLKSLADELGAGVETKKVG